MRAPRARQPRSRRIWVYLFPGILVACVLVFAQLPTPSADKKSSEVYKNVQMLKDVPSDQLVPSMKFISSSLGVHCEYCHVENAFDKDDKKPKQTARKMMQMMFAINTNNFDGHQEVTCYSCHRGSPQPLAIPVIADASLKLLNAPVPEVQSNAPGPPKPAEIVQKWISAAGGTDAISKLTSFHEQGMVDAGGHQFPIDIMIKSPNRIADITHFPGADGITTSDGTSGWVLFPGGPVRAMTAADVDASRMDADLHFPLDLKTLFTELQVEKTVKIGNKDTILLVGKRTGLPPVEMYLDAQTDLPARMVRYEVSALGLNPTQLDYSDYREVGAVKIPFHWVSAAPTGRFAIQITNAEPNAAIRDDVFAKPAATTPPSAHSTP
jgi:photosynthetic reaction center cytochrome c subunit